MIRYSCPKCKSILESPDEKIGVKINCPKCQQRLQVPNLPKNKTIVASPITHTSQKNQQNDSHLLPSLIVIAGGGLFILSFFCCATIGLFVMTKTGQINFGGGGAIPIKAISNTRVTKVPFRRIIAEYGANEAVADDKYTGRVIEFEIACQGVAKDEKGYYAWTTSSIVRNGTRKHVKCYFQNSDVNKIPLWYTSDTKLINTVTIRGVCVGRTGTYTNPNARWEGAFPKIEFKDCVLVSIQKNKPEVEYDKAMNLND